MTRARRWRTVGGWLLASLALATLASARGGVPTSPREACPSPTSVGYVVLASLADGPHWLAVATVRAPAARLTAAHAINKVPPHWIANKGE